LAVFLFAPSGLWIGIVLVSLLSFPITLVATTVQNRVLIGAKEAPDLASTLISSVFNVGTATGSWISATALSAGLVYAQLPLISGGAAVMASILALTVTALDKHAFRKATVVA
jgi:MFS transporter, DHA1 family, inner membrane transport protein